MDHTLASPPEPIPSEIQALLMQRYGNNPALHLHIYEDHRKEIVDVLAREQDLRRQHRQRIDKRDQIIRNLQPQLSELRNILTEIDGQEQRYPSLKTERKNYEEIIQNDPYLRLGIGR